MRFKKGQFIIHGDGDYQYWKIIDIVENNYVVEGFYVGHHEFGANPRFKKHVKGESVDINYVLYRG